LNCAMKEGVEGVRGAVSEADFRIERGVASMRREGPPEGEDRGVAGEGEEGVRVMVLGAPARHCELRDDGARWDAETEA
jgi:hypothetical protein